MKSKRTNKRIVSFALLLSVLALTLPLEAGRGQGGQNGDCPRGYEPGTRSMENCIRHADGTGSRYGKSSEAVKKGGGKGLRDGSGQGSGPRRDGSGGKGTGDPNTCPNYTEVDPQP